MHLNHIATWVAIVTTIVGGGVWVGAISADVQTQKAAIEKVQEQTDKLRNDGPPAIARLEAKTDAIQQDIDELKSTQKEILREIRKK